MKVCIAGGAGYIGSRLAPYLDARGYDVVVIDSFLFGNYLPPNITVTRKDLFECTPEDFVGFDQVIFLAGISNDPMAEFSPQYTFIGNSALPGYIGYCSRKAGVKRFIYASSTSIYGTIPDRVYTENDNPEPRYPYGVSKLQGEFGVTSLRSDTFSVIALRQGTVSGHSPRMRFDLFINTMFASAMTQGRIVVCNPELNRPFYDIADAVRAYEYALNADVSLHGVFNVATKNYSVIEVARDVVEYFARHGRAIGISTYNAEDSRTYKVDISLASKFLSFIPTGSVARVLDELLDNYASYGNVYQDAYWNIKIFKQRMADFGQHTAYPRGSYAVI